MLSALKRALRAAFEPGELRIETTSDPALALERARDIGLGLVVSDFRRPGMDGVQFLQQFRTIQPDAVRIMLSTSAEVQTLLRAVNDVRVLRFIVKPWLDADLVAQIREGPKRVDEIRQQKTLAQATLHQRGEISASEVERRRLESLDPGPMHVDWDPNGEVLMPDLLDPDVR